MRLRGVVLVACAAALGLAPQGWAAAPATPAPTLSILTTAAGHALPLSPLSGRWTVHRAGSAADLSVSGDCVTGTDTTVTSVFTSSWRRLKARQRAYRFVLDFAYSSKAPQLPGVPDDTVTSRVQVRFPGTGWQDDFTEVDDYTYDPIFSIDAGSAMESTYTQHQTAQFRIITVTRLHDTSAVTLGEQIRIGG